MKLYLKLLFSAALLAFSFGFLLPLLISASSTALVVVGLVYAFVLLPLFLYRINRNTLTQLQEILK